MFFLIGQSGRPGTEGEGGMGEARPLRRQTQFSRSARMRRRTQIKPGGRRSPERPTPAPAAPNGALAEFLITANVVIPSECGRPHGGERRNLAIGRGGPRLGSGSPLSRG